MTKAYKLIFLSSLATGTLISISAHSWMGMWMGLEINLLSFIPLMQAPKTVTTSESSIKYFITQALASTIILVSMMTLMSKLSLSSNQIVKSSIFITMNSSLLTKMGMAPFHFWFPEVTEGLSWLNCLLILTWQKIAPMVLIMYNQKMMMFLILTIISSAVISGIMGINQTSLRKILVFSSINHMGWMMATIIIQETIWMIYFVVYSITSINLILMLNNMKINYLKQLFQAIKSNPLIKFMFMFNFLSLGGIPPLLGFFPKWLTIQALIQNNMFFITLTMIIFTLIPIFMYTRITLTSLILMNSEQNWSEMTKTFSTKKLLLSMINFSSLMSLILVTLIFNFL